MTEPGLLGRTPSREGARSERAHPKLRRRHGARSGSKKNLKEHLQV